MSSLDRTEAEELMDRFELAVYNHNGSSNTDLPFAAEDREKYLALRNEIILELCGDAITKGKSDA